jgi:hypothetical protein
MLTSRINEKERRTSPRVPASEAFPHAVTRLVTGQRVELLNISADGSIAVRGGIRLRPGSPIGLRIDIPGVSMTLEGRVMRCRISSIMQEKCQYEAAIVLDKGFPLPLPEKVTQLAAEKPIMATLTAQRDPAAGQELGSRW